MKPTSLKIDMVELQTPLGYPDIVGRALYETDRCAPVLAGQSDWCLGLVGLSITLKIGINQQQQQLHEIVNQPTIIEGIYDDG
jgi:hypothetical protein